MRNNRNMVLDNASVDWYLYHFEDTLLQYDVYWRMWRDTLQAFLTPAQLERSACAICGRRFLPAENSKQEFVGGYQLRMCVTTCNFKKEPKG